MGIFFCNFGLNFGWIQFYSTTDITEGMSNTILDKTIPAISGIIFVSLLFFPPLRLSSSLPTVELIDLLLPVLGLIIFLKRKEIVQKKFIYLTLVFGFYIFLTISINGRLEALRDYFEIFKILKFASIIVLFSFVTPIHFMNKWIKPAFVVLVIINLIHYYNLFHINDFLDQYYTSGGRYTKFGLDSLGRPTYKRMLGLLGNPNDNAIMFMIFSIFFFPRKDSTKACYFWFGTAIIMMFLCQSRTAMVALVPMLLIHFFLIRKHRPIILTTLIVSVVCFIMAYSITKVSINLGNRSSYVVENDTVSDTIPTADITYLGTVISDDIVESQSILGRYAVWEHLWGMIKEKPVFGYGPYKEYFYERELYAENEYVLLTWRYGFIGVFIYLSLIIYLLILSYKHHAKEYGHKLLLLTILIVVTGITNVPFSHKTILVLFAVAIGLFFSELRNEKKMLPSSKTKSNEEN